MGDRIATHRPAGLLAFVLTVAAGLAAVYAPPAHSCRYVQPPPDCAKTIVVSPTVPSVLVVPDGGGTVNITSLVELKMFESPPGSGICPDEPYLIDLNLTLDCDPGGDGSGVSMDVPIDLGPNFVTVPVTVADGLARKCNLTADATLSLTDGMILTSQQQVMACIGRPAGSRKGVLPPQLDMQILDARGNSVGTVGLHPAGGSAYTEIVLTNNDPGATFNGDLTINSRNVSGVIPGMSGPQPPQTGVFSITAVVGDHFNFGVGDDLELPNCPPPGDPFDPTTPQETIAVTGLAPGESISFDVFTRAHGACPSGSCSRLFALAEGTFSGAGGGPGEAFACSSVNAKADSDVPPNDVNCTDGGMQTPATATGFDFKKDGMELTYGLDNVGGGVFGKAIPILPWRAGPADGQFYFDSHQMDLGGVVDFGPVFGADFRYDILADLLDPDDSFGEWRFEGLPPAENQPFGLSFLGEAPLFWDGQPIGDFHIKISGQIQVERESGELVTATSGTTDTAGTFGQDQALLHLSNFQLAEIAKGSTNVSNIYYTTFTNGFIHMNEPMVRLGFERPPGPRLDACRDTGC